MLDPQLRAPRPGPKIDFWTPENKTPEPVVCLSHAIVAHQVHFDRRTLPCFREVNQLGEVVRSCERCDKQVPIRWRGYLHVLRVHLGAYVFLCIPPGAGYTLQEQYGLDFDYRGLILKIHRVGGSKNKPLVVELDQHAGRRTGYPEALDPTPYLATIFKRGLALAERS